MQMSSQSSVSQTRFTSSMYSSGTSNTHARPSSDSCPPPAGVCHAIIRVERGEGDWRAPEKPGGGRGGREEN